jgi:glutamate 5-kinase
MAGGAVTQLGTGGMATKIKAAKRASLCRVGTLIVNGRIPDVVQRIFAGEELGTYFLPARDRLAARKHWIAFTKKPRANFSSMTAPGRR